MLEMTRYEKTPMHEISHGKRDRFSLSRKDPDTGRRLLGCYKSCRLSLNVISLGIVHRLSLDAISPSIGYLKCKKYWRMAQVVRM